MSFDCRIIGKLKDGNGADWTLTSDAIAGTWDVPSIGDLKLATAIPAGWTVTGAVPEPTSGLLMLLGMAGLALRRRRA